MRKMRALTESCYGKTVMSGVMGFGLGGMFGAFMASVRHFPPLSSPFPLPSPVLQRFSNKHPPLLFPQMAYDTPMHTATVPGDAKTPVSSLPWKQQLSHGLKDMGKRSYSTAKNFGTVGALFSGIECGIEGLRAKNDLGNGAAAGCISGAILARNAGPQAMAVGCAGFAAFSTAIDVYMRMPKEEE